eukprot:362150-Chlamydomonas_euryale.AAC.3
MPNVFPPLAAAPLQGASVAALGCDEFPAFFSRTSGCRAPSRVDTPEHHTGSHSRGRPVKQPISHPVMQSPGHSAPQPHTHNKNPSNVAQASQTAEPCGTLARLEENLTPWSMCAQIGGYNK